MDKGRQPRKSDSRSDLHYSYEQIMKWRPDEAVLDKQTLEILEKLKILKSDYCSSTGEGGESNPVQTPCAKKPSSGSDARRTDKKGRRGSPAKPETFSSEAPSQKAANGAQFSSKRSVIQEVPVINQQLEYAWKRVEFSHTVLLPIEIMDKGVFDAVMGFTNDPDDFFVVPNELSKVCKSHLQTLINLSSDSQSWIPYFPDTEDSFCMVKNMPYEYHRAYCYDFNEDTQLAKVYYLDTGIRKTTTRDKLFVMSPELKSIPMLAMHCRLSGSRLHCPQKWSFRTQLVFLKKVSKGILKVIVHSHCVSREIIPEVPIIDLTVDLKDDTGASVFDFLLQYELNLPDA